MKKARVIKTGSRSQKTQFISAAVQDFWFAAVQDFGLLTAGFLSLQCRIRVRKPKTPVYRPFNGGFALQHFFPAAQHFFPAVQHLRFPAVQHVRFPAVQHFGRLLGALVPPPGAILGPLDGAFEKHPPVLVSWPWLLLVGDLCLVSKRSVSEWVYWRGGGQNEGVKT